MGKQERSGGGEKMAQRTAQGGLKERVKSRLSAPGREWRVKNEKKNRTLTGNPKTQKGFRGGGGDRIDKGRPLRNGKRPGRKTSTKTTGGTIKRPDENQSGNCSGGGFKNSTAHLDGKRGERSGGGTAGPGVIREPVVTTKCTTKSKRPETWP